jgi:hypothetical protein
MNEDYPQGIQDGLASGVIEMVDGYIQYTQAVLDSSYKKGYEEGFNDPDCSGGGYTADSLSRAIAARPVDAEGKRIRKNYWNEVDHQLYYHRGIQAGREARERVI